MSTSPQTQKENHLYKVLVIGDYAVGKTSIIKRYCEGYFTPNYKLTIGVDFAVKSLEIENKNVSLQLWDVAGHERFGTMTRVYYKYAIAALVVFDLTRPATFEAVLKWRDDVNSKVILANDQPIPLVLLANKCDLEDVHVNKEELDLFCQQNGFLKWFETSALSDIGIGTLLGGGGGWNLGSGLVGGGMSLLLWWRCGLNHTDINFLYEYEHKFISRVSPSGIGDTCCFRHVHPSAT
eukprot:TRINITY_DN4302_c0_g1_i8.p1 TRINITY_DN4302_c0_g1~~TRINITY_DN4302_c0_g1_i8.p1  ORF type:complete len:237 (-),score=33.08 TRINITY_DN4302_c0_g1_i8:24-734(-)